MEVVRILYAGLICTLMAEYTLRLFFYAEPFWAPAWLWCIRLAATGVGLVRGKTWKDRGFLFLLAFQILILLRLALDDAGRIFEESVSESLLNLCWCFAGCWSVGRALKREEMIRFLRLLMGMWTVGIVAHSLISIYAAWTGHLIWTIGGGGYWGLAGTLDGGDYHMMMYNAEHIVGDIRLYTPVYATVGGGLLSVSTVLIVIAAIISRKKIAKILYALAALPVFLAMCLTDTRTGHIMTGVGIGMILFALILFSFRKKQSRHEKTGRQPGMVLPWLAGIAALLVSIVFFIFACSATIRLYNQVRAWAARNPASVISSASAEETETPAAADDGVIVVSNRGYSSSDILTMRPQTWANVLRYIRRNPMTLLTGTSIFYPMNGPNAQPETTFLAGHSHCMPLQLLLATGIPGLLLMLCFFVRTAVRAIRIVNSREMPLWTRLLPAPIVMIIAGECVECLTKPAYSWAIRPFLMIFSGLVSALGTKDSLPDSI